MSTLHIIDIEAYLEATALRAAAEAWGYDVSMTWVANSQQIVDAFSGGRRFDLVLLACHGDDGGIILPELDRGIAKNYPYSERINPEQFGEIVRPIAEAVVATGCGLGNEEFGKAALASGVKFYIGPDGDPEGDASLMYGLSFLYEFSRRDGNVRDAHARAARDQDDRLMFRLYGVEHHT